MYIDNPEISRYYELYVNIVQCHVQAYLMHILSFIVQKQSSRSVPMSRFLFRSAAVYGRMHRTNNAA